MYKIQFLGWAGSKTPRVWKDLNGFKHDTLAVAEAEKAVRERLWPNDTFRIIEC